MPSKFKNPPGSHLQKSRSNPAGFLKVHLYWPLIHMPIWITVFAIGTYVHVSLIGILGGGPLYYRFCSEGQQLEMAKEFGWILSVFSHSLSQIHSRAKCFGKEPGFLQPANK